MDETLGDYELSRDIFMAPVDLFTLRKRHTLHSSHTVEELQMVEGVLEQGKALKFVEDRHGLIWDEVM